MRVSPIYGATRNRLIMALILSFVLLLSTNAAARTYDVGNGPGSNFEYSMTALLGSQRDVYSIHTEGGTELRFSITVLYGDKITVYFVKGGNPVYSESGAPVKYDGAHSSAGPVWSFKAVYMTPDEDEYNIIITGNRSTRYEIHISGDDENYGFATAAAICIAALAIIVIFVLLLFRGGKIRTKQKIQKNRKKESDLPYRIR